MPFYKVMNCKISNFDMFLRLKNTYKKGLGKLCPSPLQNIQQKNSEYGHFLRSEGSKCSSEY